MHPTRTRKGLWRFFIFFFFLLFAVGASWLALSCLPASRGISCTISGCFAAAKSGDSVLAPDLDFGLALISPLAVVADDDRASNLASAISTADRLLLPFCAAT